MTAKQVISSIRHKLATQAEVNSKARIHAHNLKIQDKASKNMARESFITQIIITP